MTTFPPELPCVLLDGKNEQLTEAATSVVFASGRVRRRRNVIDAPYIHEVAWHFTPEQVLIFEEWYYNELKAGTEWFTMRLPLPAGDMIYRFRFVTVYSGANKVAHDLWRVSGKLQQALSSTEFLTSMPYPYEYGIESFNVSMVQPAVEVETIVAYLDYEKYEVESFDVEMVEPVVVVESQAAYLDYDKYQAESLDIEMTQPVVEVETKVAYFDYNGYLPEAFNVEMVEPVVSLEQTAWYLDYNRYEVESIDIEMVQPVVEVVTK